MRRKPAASRWAATVGMLAVAVALAHGCDDPASFGSLGGSSPVGDRGFGPAFDPGSPAPPQPSMAGGIPSPPVDAPEPATCRDNPAGCTVLLSQPEPTGQPCVLRLVDLRVEPAAACRGQLTLDGTPVACGGSDGWRLTADGRLIVLFGAACATQEAGAHAAAAFPCEVACRVPDDSGDDGGVDEPGWELDDAGVE